jgi:hypothetical protein
LLPQQYLLDAANRLSIRFGKKSSSAGSCYFSVCYIQDSLFKEQGTSKVIFFFFKELF